MRVSKWVPVVLALMLVLTSLFACTGPAEEPPAEKPSAGVAGEPQRIPGVEMPKFLTIKGMSDPAGTLAHAAIPVITNIEAAFSEISMRQIPGGSKEAIDRIISGECELGVGSQLYAYQSWFGIGDYEGKQFRGAREIYFHPDPWVAYWVARKGLGITSMKDFDKPGLRISPGKAGYSWTPIFDKILQELYGNSYAKIQERGGFVQYGNPSEMLDLFAEGKLDVCLRMGVDPWPPLTKTLIAMDVEWIPLTEEEVAIQLREVPSYNRAVTPAGTYKGQDKDLLGIGGGGATFIKADMPDDVVYNLLWAIFCEGRSEKFQEMHPKYKEPNFKLPERAMDNCVIPLHPGAIKFWKDWGYEIPVPFVESNPPPGK
ncbi:TAXI family TRAP transporter solute-binding subunit [Chloroflexota bacterium]